LLEVFDQLLLCVHGVLFVVHVLIIHGFGRVVNQNIGCDQLSTIGLLICFSQGQYKESIHPSGLCDQCVSHGSLRLLSIRLL
jgi:hypothetical protein